MAAQTITGYVMNIIIPLLLLVWVAVLPAMAHAENKQVVASIKPLHSLLLSLTDGTDIQADLLLSGNESPHHVSLKPSQAKLLADASLVIYVDEHFEQFLAKSLANLPTEKKLAMAAMEGMTLYPARSNEEEHHKGEGRDWHLWLSPANASVMASTLATRLSELFPENRLRLAGNLTRLQKELQAMDDTIRQQLVPSRHMPFITFHDATQYFDRAYGLNYQGSLTLHPEQGLSAGTVARLRKHIDTLGKVCVFAEPVFDKKVISRLTEGTNAKTRIIDVSGLLLPAGKGHYRQMMMQLAAQFAGCFR